MNNFFIKLITSNSGLSSKRFLSLFFSLVFVGIIIAQLFQIVVPDITIYSVVGLIAGNGTMTLFQKKGGNEPPLNNNEVG